MVLAHEPDPTEFAIRNLSGYLNRAPKNTADPFETIINALGDLFSRANLARARGLDLTEFIASLSVNSRTNEELDK